MKSVYMDCSPFAQTFLTPQVLASIPGLEVHVGDPDPEAMPDLLAGAVGAINGHTNMSADVIERCPSLRTIVFLGTGASSYIDVAAAARQGIKVRTVRGYGDRTIAEHAFALILAAARRVAAMDRAIRRGEWDTQLGVELEGKTLGVVGTGGTGRALIRIADAFGMQVLAWNRSGVPADLPCREVPLDTLLASSDVISLHLTLSEETRGIIDRRRLELMRRHTILLNVARGALVDEAALADLLAGGRIAHAALDVFDVEPLPPGHPFTTLDNVTLTAHAAFKTSEAMGRLMLWGLDLLRRDLENLAAGRPLGP